MAYLLANGAIAPLCPCVEPYLTNPVYVDNAQIYGAEPAVDLPVAGLKLELSG